ncbi:MAG TPA: TIGR01777 family oxidoreductase [Terracidiphilus sp.]|jgi:hypothetical protein|nr:TIGR01777 family oxidoreductase [Terracidiphilus sp.]
MIKAGQTGLNPLKARKIELMYVEMSKDQQGVAEGSDKIILSGGSGMVGMAVRTRLESSGTSVLRLVRRASGEPNEVRWDPAMSPPLADSSPLEGCSAAIHLSGASIAGRRWTKRYKREVIASRVDSTRALAQMLAGLKQPPRTLIVASAVGIYGDRSNELLDESSSPGTGFLPDVCKRWEAAAQPARDAGIRVVHTRFGVVLGQGSGALGKMLPIFKLGLGGRLGAGRQWMSWVSLEDVVRAICFCLEHATIAGPVNVCSPNPVRNSDFTRTLARQLHRPALFPAPRFALRLAFGQMADEALLASAAVHPRKLLSAGFAFTHPALTEALEAALG